MTLDVIIPCAGRGEYVARTLESVLGQTRPAEAIYLVDNGCAHSKYATVAAEFAAQGVRYVRFDERLTMTRNWQRCLGVGNGESIILLHDDDLLHPDGLKQATERLEADPRASCALLPKAIFRADGSEGDAAVENMLIRFRKAEDIPEPGRSFFIATGDLHHMSALIFRRGPIGFDPQFRWLPDQHYLYLHTVFGKVALVHGSGAFIRSHDKSVTASFGTNGRSVYEDRCYLRAVLEFHIEELGLRASHLEPLRSLVWKGYFKRLLQACFSWPWRRSRWAFGWQVARNPQLHEVLRQDLGGGSIFPAPVSAFTCAGSDLKGFLRERALRDIG